VTAASTVAAKRLSVLLTKGRSWTDRTQLMQEQEIGTIPKRRNTFDDAMIVLRRSANIVSGTEPRRPSGLSWVPRTEEDLSWLALAEPGCLSRWNSEHCERNVHTIHNDNLALDLLSCKQTIIITIDYIMH